MQSGLNLMPRPLAPTSCDKTSYLTATNKRQCCTVSFLVLRAVIWLFSHSRPRHRPLLRCRPPSRPDSSVSFNCFGKSLRTPPAVTMATLCEGLFFFSLLSDARTFAERAVWSAKVHQAGYLRRVAHVCHHRLLSVMDRWICRGRDGGN